jgi:quercetin dioxygenase-like cupin family protein
MIKKHIKDIEVENVTKANSKKTTIQWLITNKDGAKNFTMCRFEIQPDGEIGLHNHPEEHEIYILQGSGEIFDNKGSIVEINPGDVIYVPPNEMHGYKNVGNEPLAFICVIPYL